MNTPAKTLITIEHHCLQLRYASLRLQRRNRVNQLADSIEVHGQLVPIVVVRLNADENQWVLMDGYCRVNALRRLHHDTVEAEVWSCDLSEALLTLLVEHQSRSWEAIEEALLLQELQTQHQLSQATIATRLGRDQSWVSRRLSLLELLSEPIQEVLRSGKLSPWGATRILAPMARAIPKHAELLLQHVMKHSPSTRELQSFYDHYQRSNHHQRTQMVNAPDLFFKAQKLLALEKQAKRLQPGPEGMWRSQCLAAQEALTALRSLVPQVFTKPASIPFTQKQLAFINTFELIQSQFESLNQAIKAMGA